MVRVLRVSSMPFDVLVWVRPVQTGYVMYVSDRLIEMGVVPTWRSLDDLTKGRATGGA